MFMMPIPLNNKVSSLRRNLGIEGTPDVDIAFYFDTVHLALKAVSSMKDSGTWPAMEYKKCNEYNQQEPLINNVNLMPALLAEMVRFFNREHVCGSSP